MGEMSQPAGGDRSFSAELLFESGSDYGKLRESMKADAKMRGFFHYLGVQQKAKLANWQPLGAGATMLTVASLVVAAGSPQTPLVSESNVELRRGLGGKSQLVVTCQLIDKSSRPPAGTSCRAFILTRGMLDRLCGADAVRSDEAARKALSRVLAGRGPLDAFETARILAAVPEIEGEVDSNGFCRFVQYEVPEQAGHVDELPERTMLAVVIGPGRG